MLAVFKEEIPCYSTCAIKLQLQDAFQPEASTLTYRGTHQLASSSSGNTAAHTSSTEQHSLLSWQILLPCLAEDRSNKDNHLSSWKTIANTRSCNTYEFQIEKNHSGPATYSSYWASTHSFQSCILCARKAFYYQMCSCIPARCQNESAALTSILTVTLIPEVFCIWVTACWSGEGLWMCMAINSPACISHKGQLLLQELFCWIKKPCRAFGRRIAHLAWTAAAHQVPPRSLQLRKQRCISDQSARGSVSNTQQYLTALKGDKEKPVRVVVQQAIRLVSKTKQWWQEYTVLKLCINNVEIICYFCGKT